MARPSKVAEANIVDDSPARLKIDSEIQTWSVERLLPRVNNPHIHSRKEIAGGIREFEFTNDLLRPAAERKSALTDLAERRGQRQ